jgi:hypothetical protein
MKKKLSVIICFVGALLIVSAGPAAASNHFTQNEFTTADALDAGMTQSGIHFTLGEHYKSYYPEIRYGLGAMMEVGLKFGAESTTIDSQDRLGALAGVDLKYQLVKEAEGIPINMAADLGFDNTVVNSRNASDVTFSTIFSKSYPLTDRGYLFAPYGGLEMSALYGSLLPENNTSVYVFGGVEWKISQRFMLLMELKTGASTLGGAGIRFEF